MHIRYVSLFLLLLVCCLTWSLTRAQERPAMPPASPLVPPPPGRANSVAVPRPAAIDAARLEGAPRQFFLGAQRGAEWLMRMNGVNGLFLNGWVPSLNVPLEGDSFLRQVGAAFALARAARLTGEERYAACATRALLTLVEQADTYDAATQVRHTPLPSMVLNRLGAAAFLVLAINELPEPKPDLLEKSEQLCNYIRRQARPDGSLACGDLLPDGRFGADAAEAVKQYPGAALYALARSARLRPADWKLPLVRKAVAYYLPWWRTNKCLEFVSWQTAAYSEAFLLTRDRAFADAVFEMSDWIAGMQYDLDHNSQHPEWIGGFRSRTDGGAVDSAPTAQSAECGETLAMACRVARQSGDDKRLASYSEALLACLQFLVVSLQYTEANTTHFVPACRDRLAGGVHASAQDGILRIDYTQHAVSAMALFVELAVPR